MLGVLLSQATPAGMENQAKASSGVTRSSNIQMADCHLQARAKKERRRKSGRPSSMSLSEEGSIVSCIAAQRWNRSTIFVAAEAGINEIFMRARTSCRSGLTGRADTTDSALCCCGPASSPQFWSRMERTLGKIKGNNFPAYQMHGVKLVGGTQGEVGHMPARAFESNYASPPK
jgi:hypothetical protein